MKIDYFVLIYNDDIAQATKGDIMAMCLHNVHHQTIPVNIIILAAECTPQATLDFIRETFPATKLIIRSKELDGFEDLIEDVYNRSTAELVMFSKIISIPYLKRAEVQRDMYLKFPRSAGTLGGMLVKNKTHPEGIERYYTLSKWIGINHGSPSMWCFHKKVLPILGYGPLDAPHSDASFLFMILESYDLIVVPEPIVIYHWLESVRGEAMTDPYRDISAYVDYWKAHQFRVRSLTCGHCGARMRIITEKELYPCSCRGHEL